VPSVFTLIIDGQLPGRFVWRDETCVAFLSINPFRPGHTLVVPRVEVDHWVDLEPDVLAHLAGVSQEIGAGQMAAFAPVRIGLMLAGLEVPHVHFHVVPIDDVHDLDFSRADPDPGAAALDDAADRLRDALRARGAAGVAD